MTDVVHVTACRLCDGALSLITSFTPTPPGDQYISEPKPQACYPLDLMVCDACGAVQLADTVDPALIYTNYIYTTSISPGLDAHFDQYAEDVFNRVPLKGTYTVLDIGSNDGTLLRAFQRRGAFVVGMDPAKDIAERATSHGITTIPRFFTADRARLLLNSMVRPFDVITANHIMANVADLHDFIEGVKTLLAPDGTFVFETGYWPAIRDNRLIDTIEHEHIHYFAATPLSELFARHGLSLMKVIEQPTKGGSIRCFVQHKQPFMPTYWSTEMTAVVGDDWAKQIDALRAQLAVVIARKPLRERWVGYGAAVGSTLLLHHFGFGDVLEALWDDNASRHGLYSPGFHLPVVAPNSSHADKIVILAWRYADRIMAAHPEHAGKWLIPLPDVRVC